MTVTALNTQRHRYKPRGVQEDLFYCTAPEVLLSGPAGTGKSRACLEKVHQMMLAYPGARGLFIRKAREWLTSTALVTFNRDVIAADKRAGVVKWWGNRGDQSAMYEYSNGSTITIGGMKDDAQSGKVMSSEYDIIYVQEATDLDQDNWEDLTTRLRNAVAPYNQLIADCNPQQPTHWLKQRCDHGKTLMLETRHEENPFLFRADGSMTDLGRDYIGKLDNLTGVKYLRLRKGLWQAAENIIWDEYDPKTHLIDSFPIPVDWPRYWAVDFGTTHPFVWLNIAEHPGNGTGFVTQEIYRTGTMTEDHCKEIMWLTSGQYERAEDRQMRPQVFWCDHDAQERMILEHALGLPTRAATKTVLDGLEAVNQRWRNRRLFIFNDSRKRVDQSLVDARKPTRLAEEILGYRWLDPPATAMPRTAMKEGPVKDEDDGCDALRYYVAGRDLRGSASVRFLG